MDSVPSRVEDILLALINDTEYDGPIISRVEQILYSFLENSEYAAEPESRVEAILVALKAAGLYGDAVISRIEKILYSKLNGTEYAAEPESRIEELLLEWALSEEKELTGVVPLLFNADGTPLLDYIINGNTAQSGAPTPDSPIMPQGTGERTGNLFNVEMEQGSISARGVNQSSTARIRTLDFISLEAGNYVINASASNDLDCFVFIYDTSGTFVERVPSEWTTLPYAFTLSENCRIKVALAYRPAASSVRIGPSDVSNIMLNEGSTALPYELYGIKIPILTNQTTTNIYLGSTQTVRQIKKLVFTGGADENWVTYGLISNTYRLSISSEPAIGNPAVCTHFVNSPISSITSGKFTVGETYIYIRYADVTDLTEFKQYLAQQYAAGTPVTIWYVLANEETAVVNEPLMKIGDYADTLSMEQAGVEIPTVNGSNTLDVLTTVKPSEVYIKYKGR